MCDSNYLTGPDPETCKTCGQPVPEKTDKQKADAIVDYRSGLSLFEKTQFGNDYDMTWPIAKALSRGWVEDLSAEGRRVLNRGYNNIKKTSTTA